MKIRISEIFTSINGEGIYVGKPSIFVRLQGCNLRCTKATIGWDCDTPYALDYEEGIEFTVSQIVEKIKSINSIRHVVITGGEPMVQQTAVYNLILELKNYKIVIMTNGTIPLKYEYPKNIIFEVSPKYVPISPTYFKARSIFKFVINNTKDLDVVDNFVKKFSLNPSRIYLMPQAMNVNEHNENLKIIWKHALEHGYNISPRLHILAFGEPLRGV